jgi:hypothetical protein
VGSLCDYLRQLLFSALTPYRSLLPRLLVQALKQRRQGNWKISLDRPAIDDFIRRGLALNLPITVVNHGDGQHSFELDEDSDASRGIISQLLNFMQRHLKVKGV